MINKKLYVYCLLFLLMACSNSAESINSNIYDNSNYWAVLPMNNDKAVDVFFVCPSVFFGADTVLNLSLDNSPIMKNFLGATMMEKGIYDSLANFYAPYYRQASLYTYAERGLNDISDDSLINNSFDIAYSDVEAAFENYLKRSNRPFVLAGFSQGSEMLLRLLKSKFNDGKLNNRLIAAYLIGWRVTDNDLKETKVRFAESETDLCKIISFNTEAEFIEQSFIVPDMSLSINPLSWKRDTLKADKKLNKGAVFTDYSGAVVSQKANFTGAYISSKRGTLKVTDVNPDEYPPLLEVFKKGEYHIYDYLFFYNNLKENVIKRIQTYNKSRAE